MIEDTDQCEANFGAGSNRKTPVCDPFQERSSRPST
jgi:hypothetical protein